MDVALMNLPGLIMVIAAKAQEIGCQYNVKQVKQVKQVKHQKD